MQSLLTEKTNNLALETTKSAFSSAPKVIKKTSRKKVFPVLVKKLQD